MNEIHPNVLCTAIESIVQRADLFPYLEQQAIDVIQCAKREDLNSLANALTDLENFMAEAIGWVWCETHRVLFKGECPECKLEEE